MQEGVSKTIPPPPGRFAERNNSPLDIARLLSFVLLLATMPTSLCQASPVNDSFANAIQLTGINALVSGSNVNATKETGEPDHADNSGGKSVWWQWQAPSSGYVKISTSGSVDTTFAGPLDTLLAVYVGNSVSALTQIAANDDGPSDSTSEVSFHVTGGTFYRIAVDGYAFGTSDTAASGTIQLALTFSVNLPLAPAWGPLPSIDGTTLRSTDFSGKVVVLNFWATWCGPCVAEIPDLIALYNTYSPEGLAVIGISVDNSPDGINPPLSLVSSFTANQGMPYPIVMSRPVGYAVENAYGGIPYIPNTFIIDRQNHLVQTFVGSQSFSTFEAAVLPLLYQNVQLNVTVANGVAHLWWPTVQSSVSVQTTDQAQSGVWTELSATPQLDGNNQFIEVPLGPGAQFFRLHVQ